MPIEAAILKTALYEEIDRDLEQTPQPRRPWYHDIGAISLKESIPRKQIYIQFSQLMPVNVKISA